MSIIPSILQHLVWAPLRFLFTVFCSLEIHGNEHLRKIKTNVIIASNHSSNLDPIIIAASLPLFSRHLPLFYTSRERQYYKVRGWRRIVYSNKFFKMWGAYQVYVGLKDYEPALKHQLEILQKGYSMCIFPFGKKTMKGETPKAKGGVSFLAEKINVPIIPLLIEGAENMATRQILSRTKKIRVTFGKPLYAKDIMKQTAQTPKNNRKNPYEIASSLVMNRVMQLGDKGEDQTRSEVSSCNEPSLK